MIYQIMDDYIVRTYKPKTKQSFLIRCLEPRYQSLGIPYHIFHETEYVDILNLYFDDVIENKENRFQLFSLTEYKLIQNFLDSYDNIKEIVVHCNQGVSRSPAVMLLIANHLKLEKIEKEILNNTYFSPNKKVMEFYKK